MPVNAYCLPMLYICGDNDLRVRSHTQQDAGAAAQRLCIINHKVEEIQEEKMIRITNKSSGTVGGERV